MGQPQTLVRGGDVGDKSSKIILHQEQLILAFRWLQLVMWLHSAEKGPRSTILPCAQRGCSEIFENRIDDNHRAHMSVLEKIQHGLVLW